MNREQRRAMERKPKKDNPHDPNKIIQFEKVLKIAKDSVREHTDAIEFKDGDKVKINIDAVKSRPNYKKMNLSYQEFVEKSIDKIFTVCLEHNGKLIRFKEDSKWLFWGGDLIPVDDQ